MERVESPLAGVSRDAKPQRSGERPEKRVALGKRRPTGPKILVEIGHPIRDNGCRSGMQAISCS